ncbi:MAG: SPFH domain-containing protein [Neisseriaceae bacterium]|nr:SPFH domain-containing protein [Neisseriaceae bacterium]
MFGFIKKQFASVIQWDEADLGLMWQKWPHPNDEIKQASQLLLSPGQGCALVYEGQLVDVLLDSGSYALKTDNHPFVTTLLKSYQLFESEHKLALYFFRTTTMVNQAWGTAQTIKYVDPVYQTPVELGLNGVCDFKICDPERLLNGVLGAQAEVRTETIKSMLVDQMQGLLIGHIAQQRLHYGQIDAQLPMLSAQIGPVLSDLVADWGLALSSFHIMGTQFDAQTQARIGRIADVAVDQFAAQQANLSYVDLEQLRAMRDAAKNEGGLAGAGLQFGVGMQLGQAFNKTPAAPTTDGAVEASKAPLFAETRQLLALKQLFDTELITEAEYQQRRQQILDQLMGGQHD